MVADSNQRSSSVAADLETSALPATFYLSPLVRITLLSLYGALTVPLPFLASLGASPVSPEWLWLGLGIGAIALYGVLSEHVVLDEQGIHVQYPAWIVGRRGWSLAWADITALKPRSTGQGGLVYYFLDAAGQGYLLPMRVAGFARLVAIVTAKTGIDTRDVRPLSQPWMYFILLGCTLLLGLVDAWTIATAMSLGQ